VVAELESSDDFEDFFRKVYPKARGLAYRLVGSAGAAEDAAAEAFTRALVGWRRVGRLEYRTAWVLRVTTNVAVDMQRRGTRREPANRPIQGIEEPAVLRLTLSTALARLPRRQREVLALRYFAGLTEDEVAGHLGLSLGSVKTHHYRAISHLREALGTDWEGAMTDVAI
jgi:RNA polymerase sigma-70 factor (ECF subfamily)